MKAPRAETDHLAIAIAGTRRTRKRLKVDRVTTARSLAALREMYGSNQAVANKVGISPEMVREFLVLLRLSPGALPYWETGKIKSVDIGYRISARLPRKHHAHMARAVLKRNLTCQDVDSITSYMKQHPRLAVSEAVDRVLKSKDRVVYVANYTIEPRVMQCLRAKGMSSSRVWSMVKRALAEVAGRENMIACERRRMGLRLKVSREGLGRLRAAARESGVPLKHLVTAMARNLAPR